MKQFLEVGKIVGTHAIKGEVRVQPWADSCEFLLGFSRMYYNGGEQEVSIVSSRVHKNVVVMKIKGVDSVSDADALRGRVLFINRDDVTLPDGRYFIDDLIGLRIIDATTGEEYGILADITQTPANEIYYVKSPDGREHLIPAIDQVIAETSIEQGFIRINAMKGMFDDAD